MKNTLFVLILSVLVLSSVIFVHQAKKAYAPAPATVTTYTDPTTGMEFVFVRGGCYDMGDTFGDGENNEKPVHKVYVDDFYLGKYDVTVGQFKGFVNDTGYTTEAERSAGCAVWTGSKWQYDRSKNWRNPGFSQDDRHPVVCVSWNDSTAFASWLSSKGETKYCLPSESEWEYAARCSGKQYKYSWGNGEPSGNIADESLKRVLSGLTIGSGYDDGYVYTSPVGSFRPNELGLYDMTGNVWQWIEDWYGEKYYRESAADNPKGPYSGQYRGLRGGGWSNDPRAVRAAYRNKRYQADRSAYYGFRLKASCAGDVIDGISGSSLITAAAVL